MKKDEPRKKSALSRQGTEKQKVLRLLAYDKIKKMILENKLDSGKRINEKQLSEELALSRTPFREAMIMLEKESLITHAEDGGFHVRRFSLKEIADIFDLREIIEKSQVGLITQQVTDEFIEDLAQILRNIRATIDAGNAPRAMFQAMELHTRIIGVCGNSSILEVMKNIYDKLTLISWRLQKIETCIESLAEHEEIIAALRSRDSERLAMALGAHFSEAKKRVLDAMLQDIDKLYFES